VLVDVPEVPSEIVVSGARVSTRTVRVAEAADALPAASVARAEYTCIPSATALSVMFHPAPVPAIVVPRKVVPSVSTTVEFGSAVPLNMTAAELVQAPSAGAEIAGAVGAWVSTRTVRDVDGADAEPLTVAVAT
jgi:hypothetical protein